MKNLKELLLRENINPQAVLVFRHAPSKPQKFRRALFSFAKTEPEIFNAYQQTQSNKRVEQAMKLAKSV